MSIVKKKIFSLNENIGTMVANGGNIWILVKINNKKRWIIFKKINQQSSTYTTLFNGNEPYMVRFTKKIVLIYTDILSYMDDGNQRFDYLLWKVIKVFKKIFIGLDSKNPKLNGNSLLIELKDNYYMYIGNIIYLFKTDSEITNYYSPVGNSDVPYPFAITKNKIYLMIEGICLEKNDVDDITEPYHYYYQKIKNMDGKNMIKKYQKIHLFKKKILHY